MDLAEARLMSSGFTCLPDSPWKRSWVKAIRSSQRWPSKSKPRNCIWLALCSVLLFRPVFRVVYLSSGHLLRATCLILKSLTTVLVNVNFREWRQMGELHIISFYAIMFVQVMKNFSFLVLLWLYDWKSKFFWFNKHLPFLYQKVCEI